MDDDLRAEAARRLQAIVDAVDRGESSSTMTNTPSPKKLVSKLALGDGLENEMSPHSPSISGGSTTLSPNTSMEMC